MTLAAIEAIRSLGLAEFCARYHIGATRADGLISLKYNQAESPMHEPCVADCRGLVVREDDPTVVVAMAYRKFWNLGEPHADAIDWSTARVMEKLDGSLMTLYFHDGRWCVASSGHPTAGGNYNGSSEETFADAFWRTWHSLGYRLPRPEEFDGRWYAFEFCAPDNRIVVKYDRPRIVLHGMRDAETFREFSHDAIVGVAALHGWEAVKAWPAASASQAVADAAATDPLALEGFVVVDDRFRRVKVKNPRYVEIHILRGNGAHSPRSIIELWRTGDHGEVLAHFPEMAPRFDAVLGPLRERMIETGHAWRKHAGIDDRKAFAGEVKHLPLASVLFRFHTSRPDDVDAAIESHVRGMTTPALLRAIGVDR